MLAVLSEGFAPPKLLHRSHCWKRPPTTLLFTQRVAAHVAFKAFYFLFRSIENQTFALGCDMSLCVFFNKREEGEIMKTAARVQHPFSFLPAPLGATAAPIARPYIPCQESFSLGTNG